MNESQSLSLAWFGLCYHASYCGSLFWRLPSLINRLHGISLSDGITATFKFLSWKFLCFLIIHRAGLFACLFPWLYCQPPASSGRGCFHQSLFPIRWASCSTLILFREWAHSGENIPHRLVDISYYDSYYTILSGVTRCWRLRMYGENLNFLKPEFGELSDF